MWKTMMLQLFISLLPAVAYQMWNDRAERNDKTGARFIGLVSAAAMALCMVMAHHSVEGYQFDFRHIPYVIGSLYGGAWSLAFLTVVYVAFRLPFIETGTDYIVFGLFIVIFGLLLLLSIRPFQFARRSDKNKIVMVLFTVVELFFGSSILSHASGDGSDSLQHRLLLFLILSALSYFMIWCSVHIIESIKEKQLLQLQLKQLSEKYRAEVQKLQQFIDETPIGVVLTNIEGKITHINEVALDLFAGPDNKKCTREMRGSPYVELFDSVRDEPCLNMLGKALEGRRSSVELVETEGRVLVKTAFSLHDSERTGLQSITGAALIVHDITELRYLRAELDRMDRLSLVGQMAASITHEIRNPMAVIRGFVQLLKERSGQDMQDYFRIIMDELDRANAIINDFLSLAQNRLIDKNLLSLNNLLMEMLPLITADANLRGLAVECRLEPNLPELFLNDKEIKQLILNLARNGLEAMADGDGALQLSTYTSAEMVQLRVQDAGVGISQEKMERLFEPFFTTKTKGTGLGLPVCLSIAERHHGRIDVESEEGKGTTFIVKFKLDQSMAEASAASERSLAEG
ncbi:multi-sensor signal transduction histidine kinase [Paenibacillus curdlanolyticus YK9]|uniref:histidine kinase n=1 Tax=Paenibacillus curdlanolyticus YK9 TaxID=717606 RepID=E0I7I4_9BACL|nr:ATP-binding protein [Paenibacillus curdlanolyticus]EFM12000.1 multi-sensor signal transduction histidine kinase [Paenibacillus curdlanolyticus YK9]